MVKPTILSPGQTCGETYSITRLQARSPVAESYVAHHKTTHKQVILTCSRLEHVKPNSPLRSNFLANAAKLKTIEIDEAPKILDAGVHDGVYWIAREHFPDWVPLWEMITGTEGKRLYPAWKDLKERVPNLSYAALALLIGINVAEMLREVTEKGGVHGGLDPTRTVMVRADGTPAIVEAGYRDLFGAEHVKPSEEWQMIQPPECTFGQAPDARSDIYSLGVLLACVLTAGASLAKEVPPKDVFAVVRRMTRRLPLERPQRWEDVSSSLKAILEGWLDHAEKIRGSKPSPLPDSAPKTPQSGFRNRTPSDENNGEPPPPLPPPAQPSTTTAERAEEAAPATTPSQKEAAPTPRVSEPLAESAKSSKQPLVPAATPAAEPQVSARKPRYEVRQRRARLRRRWRSTVVPTPQAPWPSASKGAGAARYRWILALSITGNLVVLLAVLRVLVMNPPHASHAIPALLDVSDVVNSLPRIEDITTPAPSPAPSTPATPNVDSPSEKKLQRPEGWQPCKVANCSPKRFASAVFR